MISRHAAFAILPCIVAASALAAPATRSPTAADVAQLTAYKQTFETAFQARNWDDAAAALAGTLAIQERVYGADSPITITTLSTLAVALQLGGKPEEAEPLFRRELAARLRTEGNDTGAVARANNSIGLSLDQQNKPAQAEPFYRAAVAAHVASSGVESEAAGSARIVLAHNLGKLGKNEEAIVEAGKARDIFTKVKGANSVETASAFDIIARLQGNLGNYAASEAEQRRALAIRTGALGERAVETVASQNSLGIALTQQGKFPEAEAMLRQALVTRRATDGARDPLALDILGNLATTLQNGGNPAAAEPMLREALTIRTTLSGADHPATLTAANNLSTCLSDLGRYAEAEPFARQAFDGRLRTLGAENPETAISAGNLAAQLASLGRDTEADLLYRRALAIMQAAHGENHPDTATAYANLAYNLAEQGRYPEAEELQRRALAIRRRVLPADHPDTAGNLDNLGHVLGQQRRYTEADPLFREALDLHRRRFGERSLAVARTYNNLASNLDNLERPREAAPLYAKSLEIRRALLGPDHPQTLLSLGNVGYSKFVAGDKSGAAAIYRQVVATQRRIYGADNPARVVALNNLAMTLSDQPGSDAEALAAAREGVGIASRRRAAILAGKAGGADVATQAQVRARSADTLRNDPLVTSFIAMTLVDWTVAQREPAQVDRLRAEAFTAAQDIDVSRAGQAMARTAARTAAGGGALGRLVTRQQELTDAIAALDGAYAAAAARGDRAATAGLTASMETSAAELARVDAEIAQRFPDYRSLVTPAALDVAEVQRRLRPGEGLLLIVPSNGDMFSFAVTPTAVAWNRVPGRQAVMKTQVATILCQVDAGTCDEGAPPPPRTPFERDGYPAFDRAAAHALYRDLVKPVEGALAGTKTVYVTTTGTLATLPLGLLVTAEPTPGDEADPAVLAATPWLADRYALVTLPAVSTLRALNRTPRSAGGSFVGYGAPTLAGTAAPERGARAARGARGTRVPRSAVYRATGQGPAMADQALLRTLEPLPGTRRELAAMATALDAPMSTLRLAGANTERALKNDRTLSGSRVVAFATHGLLPQELNGFDEPGLVFTPPATPSIEDDGVLAASEAATLRLNADWVILSACNTAGAESGAESLSGLARAFLYAGARSLLASHWRVSDDATAILTVETLKADATLSRAEALQAGMRVVRTGKRPDGSAVQGWDASWAHPMAWAPFALISDQNE